MTTGIYSLYWDEQDLVYIGKSQCIEHRWKDHSNTAKNGTHTNSKVQKAYVLYGEPTYSIIESTSIDNLSNREVYWTQEFDALNPLTGLCIVPPNGFISNSTTYSNLQILKVFSLLYKKKTPLETISKRTKVNIATIKKITVGKLHIWLKERYPDKYYLLSTRSTIPNSSSCGKQLVYRDNSIHTVSSLTSFCKQHPVLKDTWNYDRSRISLVLKGSLEEYKGFKKF